MLIHHDTLKIVLSFFFQSKSEPIYENEEENGENKNEEDEDEENHYYREEDPGFNSQNLKEYSNSERISKWKICRQVCKFWNSTTDECFKFDQNDLLLCIVNGNFDGFRFLLSRNEISVNFNWKFGESKDLDSEIKPGGEYILDGQSDPWEDDDIPEYEVRFNALNFAVSRGLESFVGLLLERKDLNPNQMKFRALRLAVARGHVGIASILLKRIGEFPKDRIVSRLFEWSCYNGDLPMLQLLWSDERLRKVIQSKEEEYSSEESLLEKVAVLSCVNGKLETLDFLLNSDPNLKFVSSWPFWRACYEGHAKVVSLMIEKGHCESMSEEEWTSALKASASGERCYESFKILLDKCPSNVVNMDYLVNEAAYDGGKQMKLLCEKPAVNIFSVLKMYIDFGNLGGVQQILNHSRKEELKGNNSVVFQCAAKRNPEVFRLLLEEFNPSTEILQNAKEVATYKRNEEVINLIISHPNFQQ